MRAAWRNQSPAQRAARERVKEMWRLADEQLLKPVHTLDRDFDRGFRLDEVAPRHVLRELGIQR